MTCANYAIKLWRNYPPAHRLNVNVLLSSITFVIFAVLDVSLAINCSFFYIYICSFITFLSYYSKTAFLDCLHKSFVLAQIFFDLNLNLCRVK